MRIPTKAIYLLAPLSLLCSAACANKSVELAVPPPERFAPVAEPAVPEGNTDREVAGFIVELVTALREANARLLWLKDWSEGVK